MAKSMNVLVVKTSSLGDVIHTLPALSDAQKKLPGIRFDWVIEENFQEIPAWHPAVDQVIPVAVRRWRKKLLTSWRSNEWQYFKASVNKQAYDLVIDAQGLLKSAWLSRYANAPVVGLDKQSLREPLARWFYQRHYFVDKKQHAVERIRQLFAQVLDYDLQSLPLDYGINENKFPITKKARSGIVFLHGTTWPTKHWPLEYWRQLADCISKQGLSIKLSWGNKEEKFRAEQLARHNEAIEIIPKSSLSTLAVILLQAEAVVAVDTGLAHLAAALGIPTVSLYGPTKPGFTGAYGERQIHLPANFSCAPCLSRQCHYKGNSIIDSQSGERLDPPCYSQLGPQQVWQQLQSLITKTESVVL